MTKTPNQKAAINARREMRIRRDKTAALIFASLVGPFAAGQFPADEPWGSMSGLMDFAVKATDLLLAELDRTRKDLALKPETPCE